MNQEIKQVTKIKNPKRVAASKKSYQERMLKMKKEILENAGSNDTNGSNDGSNDIKSDNDNDTNDIGGSSTNNTKLNNGLYFYGVGGGVLIITIGFLVYYKFDGIKPQKKSVEVNTKVEEPLVYRRML